MWIPVKKYGQNYIDTAFVLARQVDPHAKLFYNEYGAEGNETKSDGVYRLVKSMVNRGIPIDGVGLQSHLKLPLDHDRASELMAKNIHRLNNLGLEVHITELDVDISKANGTMEELLKMQADVYQGVLHACLDALHCKVR